MECLWKVYFKIGFNEIWILFLSLSILNKKKHCKPKNVFLYFLIFTFKKVTKWKNSIPGKSKNKMAPTYSIVSSGNRLKDWTHSLH